MKDIESQEGFIVKCVVKVNLHVQLQNLQPRRRDEAHRSHQEGTKCRNLKGSDPRQSLLYMASVAVCIRVWMEESLTHMKNEEIRYCER